MRKAISCSRHKHCQGSKTRGFCRTSVSATVEQGQFVAMLLVELVEYECLRAANCYDFGVAATLFNPDYAATLVTSMLRL